MKLFLLAPLVALAGACIDWAEWKLTNDYYESNNTAAIEKRYYVISGPAARLWPGGTIIYCLDSATVTNQDVMRGWLTRAWNLWVDAGADANTVNFREGTAAECGPSNRANILQVGQNTNGLLRTSWGHSPAIPSSGNNPGNPGPVMLLDLNPAIAMADVIGNLAHEIGHAFGMMHEHQRPDLWQGSEYPDGSGTTNHFIFNCNNLADYQNMVANTPNTADQQSKCHEYLAAAQPMPNGGSLFSAMEFLPIANNPAYTFRSPGGGNKVDLDSIMLYGSQAGGRQVGGGRANVLTFPSGQAFDYNHVPSRRDVNALNAMYGNLRKYPSRMYWMRDSAFYDAFTQFQHDSWSC